MSDSMDSAAFDVLIKILESYRPQIPSHCAYDTLALYILLTTNSMDPITLYWLTLLIVYN